MKIISPKNFLLFTVFTTGAFSLCIEVVASRILSPYFGNTIYTFSSVISIILAALSIGYFFGGRLADKRGDLISFFRIIFASGISVLFSFILIQLFLPLVAYKTSIITGPLITSFFLFLIPSIFLGMLSPFAIALIQKLQKGQGVGSVSGTVFFFSTLGSIAGSLLSGFILIPRFGVSQIFFTTGILLTILGLIPLLLLIKVNTFKLLIFSFLLILIANQTRFFYPSSGKVLYKHDGVYEKIAIFEDFYENHPTRFLVQDTSSSGAKFMDSEEIVYNYVKYWDLYKILNLKLNQSLVIGGGAYTIPEALLKIPGNNVDVVEIEPGLYKIIQKYLLVQDNPKLHNYVTDGRRFLHDNIKFYDYIFSDAYASIYSLPSHLTTTEFYSLVKSRLNENGIFLINIIGKLNQDKPSLILSQIRTFRTAFSNSYFFAVEDTHIKKTQNFIFVGLNSKKDLLDPANNFDSRSLISLEQHLINISDYDINSYTLFTDNYSPTEYYTAQLLKKTL